MYKDADAFSIICIVSFCTSTVQKWKNVNAIMIYDRLAQKIFRAAAGYVVFVSFNSTSRGIAQFKDFIYFPLEKYITRQRDEISKRKSFVIFRHCGIKFNHQQRRQRNFTNIETPNRVTISWNSYKTVRLALMLENTYIHTYTSL